MFLASRKPKQTRLLYEPHPKLNNSVVDTQSGRVIQFANEAERDKWLGGHFEAAYVKRQKRIEGLRIENGGGRLI